MPGCWGRGYGVGRVLTGYVVQGLELARGIDGLAEGGKEDLND